MMNYDIYKMSLFEYAYYGIVYLILEGVVAYVFYDSVYFFVVAIIGILLFYRYVKKVLASKRRIEVKKQFQSVIDSVASSLVAGYSVENAFLESKKDMVRLYGSKSFIVKELEYFFQKMDVGNSLESVLADFAGRVKVDDITDFADIFVIAKRNGGNFNSIIGRTVRIMKEKDDTDREIEVLLEGKVRATIWPEAMDKGVFLTVVKRLSDIYSECLQWE